MVNQNTVLFRVCDRTSTISCSMFFKAIVKFQLKKKIEENGRIDNAH